MLRQDKEFGVEVVDLAKDPLDAGPLARSTTRNLNLEKALAEAAAFGDLGGSRGVNAAKVRLPGILLRFG